MPGGAGRPETAGTGSPRPGRPVAGLPPRAVRYRAPAPWQVGLLVALWFGAIALVIAQGSRIPPREAASLESQARILWPIPVVFVLTLYVLVRPRGPLRTHAFHDGPEAFTVVTGRVRDPGGRFHAVTVTAPTVQGRGGLAREETCDLALAEARETYPGAEWDGEPALREAEPREREVARAAWEARDRATPVPVAAVPRRPALAVAAILLGCAWVSLLPVAVIAVKEGYVRAVLAPVCREHGARQGLAYRGVRFSISNRPWWDLYAVTEVRCLYANRWDTGTVDVRLERIAGRGRGFLLTAAGATVVVVGGLLLWAGASALLAFGLYRTWRRRRRAGGPTPGTPGPRSWGPAG